MKLIHYVLAWVVVATTGVTGFWAAAAHWKADLRKPSLVPAVYVSWVLTVVEVTVGVIVLQAGVEAGPLHYFYGFLAMASIGIVYSYRAQIEEWEFLLFGVGNLFIMGLALRAVFL